ncbi:MAG: hypothetical protein C0501_08840 [Isosphaera sp.]|nr:hypothetical protein [Isosphaera sp.]
MRTLLRPAAFAAAAAVLLIPTDAPGLMIAFQPPVQRALTAETVVVGKVTAVGAADVEVPSPFPGARDKMKYRVATVKVSAGLLGADKLTEVKVGFVPPPKVDPNAKPPVGGVRPIPPRGRFGQPELKEGQELVLFLSKHPTGDFFILPGMSPPLDLATDEGKKELEAVKKVAAVLADPMKGLKSDKPDVRAETAAAVVMKYRARPEFAADVDQVAIPAEESKLLLRGLADGEWSNTFRPGLPGRAGGPTAMQAFYALQLTVKDGWVPPAIVRPAPGQPQVDQGAVLKDAFQKWLDGPGKEYVVKKVVAKKAAEK